MTTDEQFSPLFFLHKSPFFSYVHNLVMGEGVTKPISGERVIVTKLMLKCMSVVQPNYQIAAAAGLHPTTLSQYARGVKPIKADHLVALCRVFECEPEDLLGDIEVEIA